MSICSFHFSPFDALRFLKNKQNPRFGLVPLLVHWLLFCLEYSSFRVKQGHSIPLLISAYMPPPQGLLPDQLKKDFHLLTRQSHSFLDFFLLGNWKYFYLNHTCMFTFIICLWISLCITP